MHFPVFLCLFLAKTIPIFLFVHVCFSVILGSCWEEVTAVLSHVWLQLKQQQQRSTKSEILQLCALKNSLPSTSLPLLLLWSDQSFILHVVFFGCGGGKITASSKYNKKSRQRKVMNRRAYIKNNDVRNTALLDQAVKVWHMATGDAATNTKSSEHTKKKKKKKCRRNLKNCLRLCLFHLFHLSHSSYLSLCCHCAAAVMTATIQSFYSSSGILSD